MMLHNFSVICALLICLAATDPQCYDKGQKFSDIGDGTDLTNAFYDFCIPYEGHQFAISENVRKSQSSMRSKIVNSNADQQ